MSIKKHIPNIITSMNLICGIVGVIFAFKARFDYAFYLMLLAMTCDFLDGFAARTLGAYSEMGKQLDSLCDLVSFGVLPSVMLYSLMVTFTFQENILCYIPLFIALFSALRLAKFNIDPRQKDSFIGLPTPACAVICGSLSYYSCVDTSGFIAVWVASPVFIPVLSILMCYFLVCEIPMFSFKFHKDDSQVLKNKRLAMCLFVVAIAIIAMFCDLNWSLVLLLTFTCYLVKNVIYAIFKI